VAQIEDKNKTKIAVWSYLLCHVSEQLENAAPPATIEMGVGSDSVHYDPLTQFIVSSGYSCHTADYR